MADRRTENGVELIQGASGLDELKAAFETDSVDEAYFRAKAVWEDAIRRQQEPGLPSMRLPGTCVTVDGTDFHVHGVTHAGTNAERAALRSHVTRFLERGAIVYCEQGIRSMYFADLGNVCEMDDYSWAMAKCEELGYETRVERMRGSGLDGFLDDVSTIATEFRRATFSLIESGTALYGTRFEQALGDVAAGFLTSRADLAIGANYEAFTLSREASEDPGRLAELQQYYERTFLPQPLEREWLRRFDPELEIVTHARNERMADYAVFHHDLATEVRLIVGAAHQPGIRFYLERHRDDPAAVEPFESI